ncbi:hypothetical protein [Solimonas terrae]|uniref:Uncharacterized protein n=1 Tax=Solimonas terrae TaxID=1396819 RepID=A0A6M2BLQ2_9GAMM|nr:hypothetical protein [Solimonas terrae]NGY03398.1 hypothetical protein [Solimonas terrae]
MRIALMLVLCGSGLLLIAVHFGLLPWPAPRSCRALICDPVCCQLLPVGVGFVVPGLRVPRAVRRARMRGLMPPGAFAALPGGAAGLLSLPS